MTATDNQALMVLQEEGAAAPAAAPASAAPPAFFVILKPGQASEGGRDQGILVANREANLATTSSPTLSGQPPPAPCVPSVAGAAKSNTQPDNLPPECTCKGIKVTLDNNNMWNEFYRCRTEMVLTKQGRRMFPYCRFRISGMEPFQRYILVMDITPVDNVRYRWTGQQWEVTGKAEPHVLGRVFIHPDSPSSGHHWMQSPISFYKLKLTNNTLDQEGHVILHSKHRYLPRLHVVPADKATEVIQLNGPDVMTFTFPQTEFMAVTAYQNLRITQLKIDYNPFAKGFREDSPGHQTLRPRPEAPNDSADPTRFVGGKEDASSLKKRLKSLLLNSNFDNFVIDQELFSSTNYDIGDLDHSISTAESPKKDVSAKKQPRSGPPLEPQGKPRTRRGLSDRSHSTGSSDKTHNDSITVKEEEVELPMDKVTSEEFPLDGQESVDEDPVKTPAGGDPVIAVELPSDLAPVGSSPRPPGPAVSAGAMGSGPDSSSPMAPPPKPSDPELLPEQGARPAKRAERVPLPLLALFLKQRRLNPKAVVPKPTPTAFDSCSEPAPPSNEPASSSPASTSLPPASKPPSHPPEPPSPGPTLPSSAQARSSSTPAPSSPAPVEAPVASAALSPTPAQCSPLLDGPEVSRSEDGSGPPVSAEATASTPSDANLAAAQLSSGKKKRKPKPRSRKHRKHSKGSETDPDVVIGGPTDVSMQPNLEDVEGLLFVSFISKKALEFHLGDQPLNREPPSPPRQKTPEPRGDIVVETEEEKIARLEIALLQDLKHLKHRQAIHPVLQEVGLKLNLLDHTLPIDLRYLGVSLPLPPPVRHPADLCTSAGWKSPPGGAVPFVSRTGKTTDFTKIKGWREKFNIAQDTSSKPDAAAGPDGALKHRSAFCSDMLDEYLANEGKLIDERAATFESPQSPVCPVVYQLPTKSTSYVRTLDSVLKKQTPVPPSAPSQLLSPPKTSKTFRPKAPARPKPSKPTMPEAHAHAPAPALVHAAKPPAKPKSSPKAPQAPVQAEESAGPPKDSAGRDSSQISPGQGGAGGRGAGLPKTLVKLMDLEDGAVWEGKARTFVTQERAEIALASLLTAQGASKPGPVVTRIIKRRAPPCLSASCRLGCLCASLFLERRPPTHCGKPECMFGCTCLKRKVVLVRDPPKEKKEEGLIFYEALGEEAPPKKKKKKKKRMKAYTMSEAEPPSEPAARIRTLWNRKDEDDPEPLHIPEPIHIPCPPPPAPCRDPPAFANRVLKPKAEQEEDEKDPVYLYFESKMTCARVRPYMSKSAPHPTVCSCGSLLCSGKEDDPYHNVPDSTPGKATEGGKAPKESLVSSPKGVPSKVLEIVSECKWTKKSDRNHVLRVVCEHMAQNRLSHPFRIGPYRVQPLSQSRKEGQGHTVTYKVCISQPAASPAREEEREGENARDSRPGEGGTPGKSALPFLAGVSPAGILTASRKLPGVQAQGLIKVNGKSYPQAKLQLGQMGALHPANRLAAYITGRLRHAGQGALKRPSPAAAAPLPSHPAKVAVTSISTPTTVSSVAIPAAEAVINSLVTKPTVGKVVTQFVVNKISSLPQGLPGVSGPQLVGSVQKLTVSPTQLVVIGSSAPPPPPPLQSPGLEQAPRGAGASIGLTTSPDEPPRAGSCVLVPARSSLPQPLPSPRPSGCAGTPGTATLVKAPAAKPPSPIALLSVLPDQPKGGNAAPKEPKASPSPGGAGPGPRMLFITVPPPSSGVRIPAPGPRAPAPGPRAPAPAVPSFAPLSPGQRMILQPVRSSSGTTLYRHPNGHLIQLVPLSQLRAVQPNLLIRNPGSVVRLPTPVTSALDSASSTPAAPKTATAAAPAADTVSPMTPVQGKPPGDSSHASTPKPSPLSAATPVTLSSLTPSVKISPGFLGQTGTYTVRISPSASSKEPKVAMLNPAGSTTASPKVLSVPGGFTLLQLPKAPVSAQSAAPGSAVLVPSVAAPVPLKKDPTTEPSSHGSETGRGDPKAVCVDHSYTSGAGRPGESRDTGKDHSYTAGSAQGRGATAGPVQQAELREPGGAPSLTQPGTSGDSGSKPPPQPPTAGAGLRPREEFNSSPACGNESSTPPLKSPTDAVQSSAPCRADEERQPLEEGEVEAEMGVDIAGDLPSEDVTDDSEDDSEDNSEDEAVAVTSESEESEEEAAVDIETVEELSEKISIARMKAVAMQKGLDREWSTIKAKRAKEHKNNGQEEQQPKEQEEEEGEEEEEEQGEDDEEVDVGKEEGPTVIGRMQHNVMERRRRSELRDLFLRLQQVLKLEDSPKISKVFLLKKANSEIQDLVDHFDHLEARKKMLCRQRAAYIKKISQTSGKSEDMIIDKLQEICIRQKALEQQRKRKVSKRHAPPPRVSTVSEGHLPAPRSPGRRPNILRRRKPPVPTTALPSPVLSLVDGGTLMTGLGTAMPNHQVLTINGPLQPFPTILRPISSNDLPAVPGVASVTINVPGISIPMAVKTPVPEASHAALSQVISHHVTSPTGCALPKIVSVQSLVPPKAQQEGSVARAEGSAALPPGPARDSGPQPAHNHTGPSLEDGEVPGSQLTRDLAGGDGPEKERAVSPLSEFAFLDEQDAWPGPSGAAPPDGDDERSLSPLFLQLSDDAARPDQPEDDEPAPPKQEKERRSEPPPVPEPQPQPKPAAATANGFGQQSPPVSVKAGAPTPPPLLQMKTGSAGAAAETKKGSGPVPWRPMPRLTPLGLKASGANQDAFR